MGVKRAGLPKSMGGSALAFLKGKVHAKFLWAINKAVVSDVQDEDGMLSLYLLLSLFISSFPLFHSSSYFNSSNRLEILYFTFDKRNNFHLECRKRGCEAVLDI